MITTPWYPGSIKPIRPGVYQRQYTTGKAVIERYCYWNGKFWCLSAVTPWQATQWIDYGAAARQQLPWRGLTEAA